MHFDAGAFAVVERAVRKRVQIEIGAARDSSASAGSD
jgi:hypothetical protein